MKAEKWLRGLLDKYKDDLEFRAEGVIYDFTEKIVARMEELKINRSDLADRLGVSKPFITKLLNGNPNLTIKTMMSIADVLGCELSLDLYPQGFEIRSLYVSHSPEIDRKQFNRDYQPSAGEESHAIVA